VVASDIALFRARPSLRGRLPRHPLLAEPTPVEPLPLEGFEAGALWVKRDDRSCPLYGGNKPRKLEFVLGAALARGARRLVTTGALGSNHGLATTILGRDAGVPTTLVLIHQPITPAVQQALRLDAAYGARLVYGANVPGAALQALRVLAASTLRGERPFLVATGGSSRRGNVGFVSAALELAEQVRAGACPEPAEIFVPVGTGGTLAGLVAGLALAGLRSRVVGVLVTDILPPSPRRLARTARSVLSWLRHLDPALPGARIGPADFDLLKSQLGAGYGAPTEAGRSAVAAAAACGLRLETTYTGKCLAAIRDRRRGEAPRAGPILFWNTFNGVDVAIRAPADLEATALPRLLRRFLAPGEVDGGEAPGAGASEA
jgi:D-cysteine desulfhydrase